MKIENVYIKPDGQIYACTVPVPEGSDFAENSQDGSGQGRYDQSGYEAALKACKESAVPFEDKQHIFGRLLSAGVEIDYLMPDTFYPLQCSIQIGEACAHDSCPVDAGCEHCKEPMRVARLIPEATDPPHPHHKAETVLTYSTARMNGGPYAAPPIKGTVPEVTWINESTGGIIHKDPAPIVEESQTVKIEVNKNAIPRNAKLVEAYETEHRIIVMFGKEEIPESHSCDEMGCGSFSHVKYILTKP